MTTATATEEKVSHAGETNCLGWCGMKFWSPDKTRIRFCSKCRNKRNSNSETLSRMELRYIHSTGRSEQPATLED